MKNDTKEKVAFLIQQSQEAKTKTTLTTLKEKQIHSPENNTQRRFTTVNTDI